MFSLIKFSVISVKFLKCNYKRFSENTISDKWFRRNTVISQVSLSCITMQYKLIFECEKSDGMNT